MLCRGRVLVCVSSGRVVRRDVGEQEEERG